MVTLNIGSPTLLRDNLPYYSGYLGNYSCLWSPLSFLHASYTKTKEDWHARNIMAQTTFEQGKYISLLQKWIPTFIYNCV